MAGPTGMANGSAADLMIADWEYLHSEQILMVYVDHLIAAAGSFASIMGKVRAEAVNDGEAGIASACEAHAATMATVKSTLDEFRVGLTGQAMAFVTEIDEEDKFLYGEG